MVEEISGDEKLKGALAYLLGPISGIFLLLIEKTSSYIRFHAFQSTLTFGALWIVYLALTTIPFIGWYSAFFIAPFYFLGELGLWLFLMWKAYNGEKYKLPYIGDFAEKQLAKLTPPSPPTPPK